MVMGGGEDQCSVLTRALGLAGQPAAEVAIALRRELAEARNNGENAAYQAERQEWDPLG